MHFHMPPRVNPVCDDCQSTDSTKWELCQSPCNHLVSWAAHQAVLQVIEEAKKTSYEAHPCALCTQETEGWTREHCKNPCQRLIDWQHRGATPS
jgi:hypothetical protein